MAAKNSAQNQHAMRVAGQYDDGDGVISDQEWTKYQQSLGNTWSKSGGWTNGGQPQSNPSPSPAPTPSAPKVSNINNFDRTSGGAGSQKGTDRLSASDLKNLRGQGHSLQDIVNYAEKSYGSGSKGGQSNSKSCLLYTSPSPRDRTRSRMPSSA